ncbi:hypothetical protein SOVF_211160 [Spinacia oleracea]|uniref:Protein SENSITIVE TO PROTON RHIZOTOXICITY 2 n=1 Tax=Spinacia oleracea TaxID=3562 RepID=A0A9R0K810_SPIOL|nr:protein SENSITIVE TO PROTON RHIZOTOXICITY 2-like [Spinacia oleracea]KNA03229.1 hypothetical protein SOVF_211160 [Spinacia oleracea]
MSDSNNTLHLPLPEYSTTGDPLTNLSAIQHRVDSLSRILSNSVNRNTPLSKNDSNTITAELTSAIHHVVINGAALLSSSHVAHHSPQMDSENPEIVELDAMELTAEYTHTCQVCGKGFKRDANLRMHMRAHGDRFKTLDSLMKPGNLKKSEGFGRETRFSCPYVGCNRNKKHNEFRALKSVVCVKNHFKRSHCPKRFPCNRCKKKRFSVLSDLKSHMKHCTVVAVAVVDENTCSCSCGRMFSNKEELFEHMSLFEGHMPANVVVEEVEKCRSGLVEVEVEVEDDQMGLWSSIEELIQF